MKDTEIYEAVRMVYDREQRPVQLERVGRVLGMASGDVVDVLIRAQPAGDGSMTFDIPPTMVYWHTEGAKS